VAVPDLLLIGLTSCSVRADLCHLWVTHSVILCHACMNIIFSLRGPSANPPLLCVSSLPVPAAHWCAVRR
jgi:hypothetical protein